MQNLLKELISSSGSSPLGMKDIRATGFITITKPFTSVPDRGTILKDVAVKCNF